MSPVERDEAVEPPMVEAEVPEIAPAGRFGHLVAGVVPVALGLACLAYSVSLSLGTPVEAGPGLWPAVASLLLVGAGSWSLLFERGVRDTETFSRGAIGIGAGVVSLVAYTLLITRVGFEIPTLLLMVLWLRVLGRESWRLTAVVSVVTTAVLYLVFITLLGVPLPRLAY